MTIESDGQITDLGAPPGRVQSAVERSGSQFIYRLHKTLLSGLWFTLRISLRFSMAP